MSTSAPQGTRAGNGDEDPKQRRDRELIELLNELRVALPGVQVLFAFLLTLPLSQRFTQLSDLQRAVYFVTFLAAAVAAALLMTPTAYHRLRFREADKERLLRISNRTAVAGIAFLVLSVVGSVFLIADLLFRALVAPALFAGLIGAVYLLLWFVIPLIQRLGNDGSPTEQSDGESE